MSVTQMPSASEAAENQLDLEAQYRDTIARIARHAFTVENTIYPSADITRYFRSIEMQVNDHTMLISLNRQEANAQNVHSTEFIIITIGTSRTKPIIEVTAHYSKHDTSIAAKNNNKEVAVTDNTAKLSATELLQLLSDIETALAAEIQKGQVTIARNVASSIASICQKLATTTKQVVQ